MAGVRDPRLVVVTGAGSGIGRATALRFARNGAGVVAVDIDEAAAKQTASDCGPASAGYGCDVADADALGALAGTVESTHGPVDVLVNNAGVGLGGPFLESTPDDWAWIRSINLDGVVHGCHAFGGPMVARGRGQVVNVSSGLAYVPSRRTAAYCATKAGVRMLSESLRADWAARGVGVSVICPGVIDTPILGSSRLRAITDTDTRRFTTAFRHGHPPDLVAKAIERAAARNSAVVPVGWESVLGHVASRLTPGLVRAAIGRI